MVQRPVFIPSLVTSSTTNPLSLVSSFMILSTSSLSKLITPVVNVVEYSNLFSSATFSSSLNYFKQKTIPKKTSLFLFPISLASSVVANKTLHFPPPHSIIPIGLCFHILTHSFIAFLPKTHPIITEHLSSSVLIDQSTSPSWGSFISAEYIGF